MNVKQLQQDTQVHLGIGDRALRKRVAKAMDAHRTITRNDALLLVAANAGITIARYVQDQPTLDRIRQLRQSQPSPPPKNSPNARDGSVTRAVPVGIARDLQMADPVLPERIIGEARMMAERVYPKLYIFENSVREVILRVMRKAHGPNWWDMVPIGVQREIERRKADEKRRPWHGKRGAHEIYYTDIADLTRIANSNPALFKDLFPDLTWFNHIVGVITPSRNVSSHHNPLRADDVRRIDVYLKDWHNHIRANLHLIPD